MRMTSPLEYLKIISRPARLALRQYRAQAAARRFHISLAPPNFMFQGARLSEQSVLIDVGCADDADLSQLMIARFNLTAYGVDPTRKHALALQTLEKKSAGHFHYVPLAVAAATGELVFHESKENVSGSLRSDHHNVTRDTITAYSVQSVTIPDLIARLGLKKVDYLKLDIEGAEYELVRQARAETFAAITQILIEFHHHAVPSYTIADTDRAAATMRSFGYRSFSVDRTNYLFFKA